VAAEEAAGAGVCVIFAEKNALRRKAKAFDVARLAFALQMKSNIK